jgi:cold shock CspA family protein
MDKPFEIVCQGFKPSEAQDVVFQQKVRALERKFGRIASGRLVVRAPSGRHQRGGLYGINIRLRLHGGKEVESSKTPDPDDRYSNFRFALNDAFKRAERQLLMQVDRLEGEVKSKAGQPIGTVARLFEDHGFIESPEGLEIYFHRNSVLDGAFGKLEVGSRVAYAEETGEQGPQASTVRLLGKHGLK